MKWTGQVAGKEYEQFTKNQTVKQKKLPEKNTGAETSLKQTGWEDIKWIQLATNRDWYVLVKGPGVA
jgi:hypothetical protein